MKKKNIFAILSLTACLVMMFSTVCFAGSREVEKEYGAFTLTCNISCDSSKGTGSTSGSANPYKDYVSVTIYNKDGVSVGSSYKTQKSKVTLTLTKFNKVYQTRTSHAVVDENDYYLEPLSQSIILYEAR